ncbi:hypothetical protein [Nocardioides sp. GY 10127]|uniref:hypothetical protein n=1 Tax=Nocardioides sp. GY 10127 TaxID=2569762 RepID=UPI0010A8F1A3|nr:hypothetical protein [Nocardioides sp. GY 10127]TIC84155.1 hypothetical protein E8D37_04965 [Nocardioides sp. GY 10127]
MTARRVLRPHRPARPSARGAAAVLGLGLLVTLLSGCAGDQPGADADLVTDGDAAVAVTVSDGEVLVQRRDDGDWDEPSSVLDLPDGEEFTSATLSAAGGTYAVVVVTQASDTTAALADGTDADDLESGLLAISTGPGEAWQTHAADPSTEAFVSSDGSAAFQGYSESGDSGAGSGTGRRVLVWRDGDFSVEAYAKVRAEVEALLAG